MCKNHENCKLADNTTLTEGKTEKIINLLKELFDKVDMDDLDDGLDEIISLAITNPEAEEDYTIPQLDNHRFIVRQIQRHLLRIHAILEQ